MSHVLWLLELSEPELSGHFPDEVNSLQRIISPLINHKHESKSLCMNLMHNDDDDDDDGHLVNSELLFLTQRRRKTSRAGF